MFFLLLKGLCWELSVVCEQIASKFYGFQDKLDRKRLKTTNFQNLKVFIFHPICMQISVRFSLMGLLMANNKIWYFISKRGLFRIFERYIELFLPILMFWFLLLNVFSKMLIGFLCQRPSFLTIEHLTLCKNEYNNFS